MDINRLTDTHAMAIASAPPVPYVAS